jgi:hypothetical protein
MPSHLGQCYFWKMEKSLGVFYRYSMNTKFYACRIVYAREIQILMMSPGQLKKSS